MPGLERAELLLHRFKPTHCLFLVAERTAPIAAVPGDSFYKIDRAGMRRAPAGSFFLIGVKVQANYLGTFNPYVISLKKSKSASVRVGSHRSHTGDHVQMDVTKQLAAFTSSLTVDQVPEPLRKECRLFVLDALSVMVGAALFARTNGDKTLSNYLKVAAPPGPRTEG